VLLPALQLTDTVTLSRCACAGVERTIKKKRKILGDQPKFLIFFAGRRSCENLQGEGEQPVKRAWVDRKARGERIAKVRCHRSKDRTPNVTVAARKGWIFPNQQNV
jgi:hypothetical protein